MSDKYVQKVLHELKKHSVPKNLEGMACYGIKTEHALGVSIPILRKAAKDIGKNHSLALNLWKTKIHEARILATMIDIPEKVTEKQMELWTGDFDSWDICDQCCLNLFHKTKHAWQKAFEWCSRKGEFEKRAGFALIAVLAVHDKASPDKNFIRCLPYIKRASGDKRNFVKKAVNWSLRQIGKRNTHLNKNAILYAREIIRFDSKTARWVASDALRELESLSVRKRLKKT